MGLDYNTERIKTESRNDKVKLSDGAIGNISMSIGAGKSYTSLALIHQMISEQSEAEKDWEIPDEDMER